MLKSQISLLFFWFELDKSAGDQMLHFSVTHEQLRNVKYQARYLQIWISIMTQFYITVVQAAQETVLISYNTKYTLRHVYTIGSRI
jgi:hypothetical protein